MEHICKNCADSVEFCSGNPLAKSCDMWIECADADMKESFLDAKYGIDYPHFYIRGVLECYSYKVIDRLTAKGGINSFKFHGCDPGCAYYIGPADNIIYKIDINSPEFKNLIDACGWIELK